MENITIQAIATYKTMLTKEKELQKATEEHERAVELIPGDDLEHFVTITEMVSE